MNVATPDPTNVRDTRLCGATWLGGWLGRWGCLLALMALVAGGWAWSRWASSRQARAWVASRAMASRESVFDAAKVHAARFGSGDWDYLMTAAIHSDEGMEAWLARRRLGAPLWLQAWLPVSAGQERWIDLELAWRSCPGKDDALRIVLIQRAAGAAATQAWRLMDLAMGEGEPLSLEVVEAAAQMADAADDKVRLVVANGLARASPEAQATARRLLEGWLGDANPGVSETAWRVLERAPYR